MTVEEYICDKLKDDFNITVTHLLCKLVHTNEFDLNILTDFLKLIDYYRLQGDPHVPSNIKPDFSLSNLLYINNSLEAIHLASVASLLDAMIELPSKVKMLFGAPYWLIKDLDLESSLTLCSFDCELVYYNCKNHVLSEGHNFITMHRRSCLCNAMAYELFLFFSS